MNPTDAVRKENETINAVAEATMEFMWEQVARAYSETNTGDVPPDVVFKLETAIKKAVGAWITFNVSDSDRGAV